MGLNKPCGGVTSIIGRIGQMPTKGEPYSRVDMYDEEGNWFNKGGLVPINSQ